MSRQICHAHCPGGGGDWLAIAAMVAAGIAAWAVAQVVASLFAAIMITGGVLCVAGVVLFVVLIRRDRLRVPLAVPAPRAAVASSLPQRALEGKGVLAIDALQSSCDDVLERASALTQRRP